MKMMVPTEDQCWTHYHKEDAWFLKKGTGLIANREKLGLAVEKEALEYGKDIIRAVVNYMTAGPVVAIVLEGNNSGAVVKRLVGSTEPASADTGTIRGDFAIDSYFLCDSDGSRGMRNLVHCTDPEDGAEAYDREVNIWFTPAEIVNYRLVSEAMLYDVNLDGILE
jgi:nucleoside-diphosphate kinase